MTLPVISTPLKADLTSLPAPAGSADTVSVDGKDGGVFELVSDVSAWLTTDSLSGIYKTSATPGKMWARVRKPAIVSDFGIKGDNSTDNTAAINAMETTLSTFATNSTMHASVYWPSGNYLHSSEISKRTQVNWYGEDRNTTVLTCTAASGTQMSAVGAVDAGGKVTARQFWSIRDMKFYASAAANQTTGLYARELIRAYEALVNVSFIGHGSAGILIGQNTQDCGFIGVDISNCGKVAANGTGLKRESAGTGISRLLWERLSIEECGIAASTGGGILWTTPTAPVDQWGQDNVWFNDLRIQQCDGNSMAYFGNSSAIGLQNIYVEGRDIVQPQNGIVFNNCIVNLSGMSRWGGRGGYAMRLENLTELHVAGRLVISTGYANGDAFLTTGSTCFREPTGFVSPVRITADATSAEIASGQHAGGIITVTGTTATKLAGRNFTVVRTGAGVYTITFSKAAPNVNYIVNVNASDASATPVPMRAAATGKAVGSFVIRTINQAGTAADAKTIEFSVVEV
jgi:Pectate lyase superfamily protein